MNTFHFKQLSLKKRFIYAFVMVIIITITILSLANYFYWNSIYHRKVRNEGLILTQTLMQGCVDPIIRNDFYSLEEYAKNLIKERDIAYVMIMDRHNHVLAQKPDDSADIPQDVNKKVKDNITPYLIQTYYNTSLKTKIDDISCPVLIDAKKWGTVRVGFSLEHMRKEITRNILVVIVTGLISMVIGIVMALILSSFVTGPIEKFVHSMKNVTEGNLDEQISLGSSHEFGVMARSFNQMARSLRKSEDELRKTYQRLVQKEKMAALGELTARVAHKIKNPLGIIKSSAQILVDETKDPEDKIEVGTFIIEEVNLLDSKIHNLLNYAKPKPPTFQEVDLNDILKKKVQFWESQKIEERKISITRRFNRDIPHLFLDEEQIGEITLNMIINACEAMHDGGELIISTDWGSQSDIYQSKETNCREGPGKLHAQAFVWGEGPNKLHAQGFVWVEFEDTGIGIPPKNLKKIFDPFFTTKKKGNGLGLSAVYRIVENHRGKIEVESKEGKGSKFTIFFPITKME